MNQVELVEKLVLEYLDGSWPGAPKKSDRTVSISGGRKARACFPFFCNTAKLKSRPCRRSMLKGLPIQGGARPRCCCSVSRRR